MRTLVRIRKFVNQPMTMYLYNALINAVFMVNDFVYNAINQRDENKLQVAQICLQCDRLTPREGLYANSKVLPLKAQCMINTCGIVYQSLNQNSTPFVNGMFSKVTTKGKMITRSMVRGDSSIPFSGLELTRGNISIRGPSYYNKIPLVVRELPTYKQFKHNFKVHIRDEYF